MLAFVTGFLHCTLSCVSLSLLFEEEADECLECDGVLEEDGFDVDPEDGGEEVQQI